MIIFHLVCKHSYLFSFYTECLQVWNPTVTCWTLKQPYQIIPKLKLGSAVNIAPGEKDIKNRHTQIVSVQN